MKAIYLDIDGVLNSYQFEKSLNKYKSFRRFYLFDQRACLRLLDIIEETGAYVILSSSWRITEEETHDVQKQLTPYGIKLFDMTGQEPGQRGDQIKAHLERHPEITNYVVLDDDSDMDAVADHLVLTTLEYGLEDEHVEKAIEILNR